MYESKVSSEMKDPKRRNFLRKIFTLTASAGVAGLLLDRLPGRGVIQPVEASSMTIDSSNSGAGTTSLMSPGSPALTATNTGSGAALQGTCTAGTGVYGNTTTGTGVQGTASAAGGRALFGFVTDPGAMPLVAQGPSGSMQVNSSGAMLATQVGQSSPNVKYASPGNPPSFSNSVAAGYLADGLAIPFTPKLTGNVLILASVDFFNPNSDQSTFGQIWYGTGTAPGFGATLPGSGIAVSPGRGNPHGSGSLFAVVPGLTVNTPYWFDLAHGVQVAGVSGSHNNIAYIIVEI